MAKGKTRMTVFSRFLLFMLFVGPLAYWGANSYVHGDGIQGITNLIEKGKEKVSTTVDKTEDQADTYEVKALRRTLNKVKAENKALKQKIERLEKALQAAKSQGGAEQGS